MKAKLIDLKKTYWIVLEPGTGSRMKDVLFRTSLWNLEAPAMWGCRLGDAEPAFYTTKGEALRDATRRLRQCFVEDEENRKNLRQLAKSGVPSIVPRKVSRESRVRQTTSMKRRRPASPRRRTAAA